MNESHLIPAFLFTLFAWWFTTGFILLLNRLRPSTFIYSFLGATGLAALGFVAIGQTGDDASVRGAYLSFSGGLMLWGWNELAFLLGIVTGPRRSACPEECGGWPHFKHAIEAILYHEVAIGLTALAVAYCSRDAVNQTGMWTFLLLWIMRISAKLNLFLGVQNLATELLPVRLEYLASFFKKRSMNMLFPFSVTGCTALTLFLADRSRLPGVTPFEEARDVLLGTLALLALIEHWFLVIPVVATRLWSWGLSREEPS